MSQKLKRAVDLSTYRLKKHKPYNNKFTCYRKRKYETEWSAWATLYRMIMAGRHVKDLNLMSPYLCDHCSSWHLGHKRLETVVVLLPKNTSVVI